MAQKLLLFWRKPARRCWWEGVELENVDGVEGKLKVWIRRVWTLEMVSKIYSTSFLPLSSGLPSFLYISGSGSRLFGLCAASHLRFITVQTLTSFSMIRVSSGCGEDNSSRLHVPFECIAAGGIAKAKKVCSLIIDLGQPRNKLVQSACTKIICLHCT